MSETIKSLQKQREEFLLDMLEYYTVDPDNRRNYLKVSQIERCSYAPISDKSEGCAIGRKIPLELAKEWDKHLIGAIDRIDEEEIPEELSILGVDFLQEIQILHDIDFYWESIGLSKAGKIKVKNICKAYFIDETAFSKFLD